MSTFFITVCLNRTLGEVVASGDDRLILFFIVGVMECFLSLYVSLLGMLECLFIAPEDEGWLSCNVGKLLGQGSYNSGLSQGLFVLN